MTTQLIGVKEFRQNIAGYARRARTRGQRYIVLNRNAPLFEVRPLGPEDAALEKLVADVAEARFQSRHGKVTPLKDVMREFGLV